MKTPIGKSEATSRAIDHLTTKEKGHELEKIHRKLNELVCTEGISRFFFISGSRRVTPVTNAVTSHKQG